MVVLPGRPDMRRVAWSLAAHYKAALGVKEKCVCISRCWDHTQPYPSMCKNGGRADVVFPPGHTNTTFRIKETLVLLRQVPIPLDGLYKYRTNDAPPFWRSRMPFIYGK